MGGLFTACDDSLEVNAPAKDITVVYGLLDQSDSLHYFRINRAFLTDGDANVYAKQKGMPVYKEMEAFVEEWENGGKENTYQLRDTLVPKEDEGAFAGGEHKVYYFAEPDLNGDAEYRLRIHIREGGPDEKRVKGSTELVKDFEVANPRPNNQFNNQEIPLYSGSAYQNFGVKWTSSENGKRYELSLRFNYKAVTASDTIPRSVSWKVGAKKVDDGSGSTDLELEVSGERFYRRVGQAIEKDPDVEKRLIGGIDFVFAVAGKEFDTFMEVNEPSSSIVQQNPEYTNLDTAAVGIFGSRFRKTIENKWLDQNSLDELARGGFTDDLNFCTDTVKHQGKAFYCP